MTKKLLGRFSFEGGNIESIENCVVQTLQRALDRGWDEEELGTLINYIEEREMPHMARIPEGTSANLVIYKDKGDLQAIVEVEGSLLSKEQFIDIIRGPETDGGKMSPGDKNFFIGSCPAANANNQTSTWQVE